MDGKSKRIKEQLGVVVQVLFCHPHLIFLSFHPHLSPLLFSPLLFSPLPFYLSLSDHIRTEQARVATACGSASGYLEEAKSLNLAQEFEQEPLKSVKLDELK